MRSYRFIPLILLPCLILSMHAQTLPGAHPPQITTLTVKAKAVVLEVVVITNDDQPVAGLHQDDFQIAEDGIKQSTTSLEEHSAALPPPQQTAALPPNQFTNVPSIPPAEDSNSPKTSPDVDPLIPLLQHGLPSSTQIAYDLHVQASNPQPAEHAAPAGTNPALLGPRTRYSADFTIHWTDNNPQLSPQGTHTGKLRVELVAFDRDGKALNWIGGSMDLSFKDATYAAMQKSGIPAHLEIDVPKRDIYLATGICDYTSNKAGTLKIPLTDIKSTATQQQASTPARSTEELVHRTPESFKQEQAALRHITLNVVVTDTASKPIGDLQQQDFTLMDNGNSQSITAFRAIQGAAAQPLDQVIVPLDAMNPTFQDVVLERQGIEKYLRQNGGRLALPLSIVFLSDAGVKLNQPSRDGNAIAADMESCQHT